MNEGWHLFDYAVVRCVPRVHTGAFVNIGVVLLARQSGYLRAAFHISAQRLGALQSGFDVALLQRFVEGYQRVCDGGAAGGMVGLLPASERFHWLTAPRSAVIQTSPVHPGRCRNLDEALQRLCREQCGD
ncbi:MAG: DUF3037 domain-containing protein [Chlorobi bacterium CHB2]|nr:DUF3037 domain-containing protein [Chlorobi bacterium CHB2]